MEAKDYELRRSKGQLATASVAESRARNLEAVPHSFSADGKLRYGDTIQLRVPEEDGNGVVQSCYLANNIFEPVDAAARTVAVSATHMDSAVARNTFVITRAPSKTHYEVRTLPPNAHGRTPVLRAGGASNVHGWCNALSPRCVCVPT